MAHTDDNAELAEHTRLLIELNEPEALLESLRRVCLRKADRFLTGEIPPEEAIRWRTAASALSETTKTITQAQEPQRAPNEPDQPNPQPGAVSNQAIAPDQDQARA